jgi:hypothetical protein
MTVNVAPSRSSLLDLGYFQGNVEEIAVALDAFRDGDQTLDVLERNGPNRLISQAEYLYTLAVLCLKIVREIAARLHQAGWGKEDEELFLRTFENLADVWPTYKRILGSLECARWGGEPSPDQIFAALERPRRRYIIAMDAYRVQLLIVREYVRRAMDDVSVV